MAQFELVMPKMGESVAEATIIKWTKNEGDAISADETVLEIATDKVDSEVPAARAGILEKKLFKEGEVVAVGTAVAIMRDASTSEPASPPATKPSAEKTEVPVIRNAPAAAVVASSDASARFYSPLVKNIARQEGISQAELDNIAGSGKDGRLTKEDILNYLPQRSKTPASPVVANEIITAPAAKTEVVQPKPAPVVSLNAGDEIIEMDRMRKLIADHMVRSKQTSPHVTSFVEADVTNLVLWRERVKKEYEKREKEKITFTPLFVEAVAKAIRDYPMINVSVDGSNIIRRKSINIGMATALPSGNLIVPVIRNADMLNLSGLTRSVNDLALRARENKLQPDEISGGTFTISNVGSFGNVMGTPIINQPQVAILAVGAIKKKPAVLETPQGDVIAIRHMMFLSLSYDHRVVDGSLGGSFLRKVADYLENFDLNRPI